MKGARYASPDDYVASLDGWQRGCVERLRKAVRSDPRLDEVVKWGHLVYVHRGPVLLIRAEAERVLFGFWRGQRLLGVESRLKPSGRYEMATLVLREGDSVKVTVARQLAREAADLNARLGDPRDAAKPAPRATARGKKRS